MVPSIPVCPASTIILHVIVGTSFPSLLVFPYGQFPINFPVMVLKLLRLSGLSEFTMYCGNKAEKFNNPCAASPTPNLKSILLSWF